MPDSVEEIEELAFSWAENLKKIRLPENGNLKKISYQAFFRCHNVESIIIPKSVETIGKGAFSSWGWRQESPATIYVRFKENEIPEGWGNALESGDNTKIVYGYTGE